MDQLDPILQYGPNDGGYAGALQIAIISIAIIIGTWLLGVVWTLIRNSGKNRKDP